MHPWQWTIAETRHALATGDISPTEYAEQLRQRAADLAHLRALVHELDAPGPGASADGPLAGIAVVVKDCIDTADAPTTAGTGAFAGRVPPQDAPAVRALCRAGAAVTAKCAQHELSFGVTSDNPLTGPPRNPHDARMICGGSSGGTAAAVAAGLAPVGIGADTGGSVRMPAALCGVVGFRPTVGRYGNDGAVPIAHTRDTLGPMARCVADIVAVDAVLAGRTARADVPAPATLRLGVPAVLYRDLDADVDRVARGTLDLLAGAGVELVEVDVEPVIEAADAASGPISMYEFAPGVLAYATERGYGLTADDVRAGIGCAGVRAAWDRSATDDVSQDEYRAALRTRALGRRRWAALFERHHVTALVQPTAPLVARPLGEEDVVRLNGRDVPTFDTFIRHTGTAGVLGLPGISLPAGAGATGLPVGMELAGRSDRDDDLLAVATAVERLLPPPKEARPAA